MSSRRANSRTVLAFRWLLLIVWLFLQPNPANGNSETLLNELNRLSPVEREKKLIQGAKKEGGGVIYSRETSPCSKDTKGHLPSVILFSKRNIGSQAAIGW